MSSTYVTTAIPYVNADPHIGFALESVIADVIARHRRKRGDDVRFLTGTDDNSLKSVQGAEREGVPVAELVARFADRFEALRGALDLSTDDFIRTSSDPRHLPGVHAFWRACAASGDIYRSHYRGRYCVGCERFVDDADGCPEHEGPLEEIEEDNYFFRLSRYEQQLLNLIESGRLRIVPAARRNEVLALIRSGLRDFSISRSAERARGWGVPVPDDPAQVCYVWFDALGNYVTALEDGLFDRFWRDGRVIHVIGKDIIRFHAVYWPAFLLSAGLPLPDTIVTHGFITADGRKISKSLGNTVDPFALVREFGVDTVRYFLLRHIRTTDDGDFTRERLVDTRDADLADQLGNLVSRVVALVCRSLDGVVPAPAGSLRDLAREVDAALDGFELHEALAAIWRVVEDANRSIVATKPWELARDGDPRLSAVLGDLCASIRLVADELEPFLPTTSREILRRVPPAGGSVVVGPPLFPKG
jgi:methionyl-tRNA synthetase